MFFLMVLVLVVTNYNNELLDLKLASTLCNFLVFNLILAQKTWLGHVFDKFHVICPYKLVHTVWLSFLCTCIWVRELHCLHWLWASRKVGWKARIPHSPSHQEWHALRSSPSMLEDAYSLSNTCCSSYAGAENTSTFIRIKTYSL